MRVKVFQGLDWCSYWRFSVYGNGHVKTISSQGLECAHVVNLRPPEPEKRTTLIPKFCHSVAFVHEFFRQLATLLYNVCIYIYTYRDSPP